ncbi:MAG: 4-hydroxythreonine-4-phosphate dehydrogenase PdxA [Flavobacteriales bacterium]|nr:4-hydroxythreonine-4-phosphate dehydrogenase PdxA [Flavobacteriales bacterium]|tara:strand:+ start:4041 stop:5081 length:1041 start_codon:yes stop_codon:yes gene_type:complete
MIDQKKIVLGISCGDISGVGVEAILKAFSNNDLFEFCTPVLYVPQQVLNYYKKKHPELQDFNYYVVKKSKSLSESKLNVIKILHDHIDIRPGFPSALGAQIAVQSLDLAIKDLKSDSIQVLLTLPVNKHNISTIKKSFIGHTEYMSDSFNDLDTLMILCHEKLRIATLTNHVPISKVSKLITKASLKNKLDLLIETLRVDFLISKPKIAVLGLNPHAGDDGLVGSEEIDVIAPVINDFFNQGHLVYGPYSADAFFGKGSFASFDAVLGMYHDQALIPFKFMSFNQGVNYTAGLPVIRVSPDHGVAYDIAGQNTVNIDSILSAIFLGIKLYSNRQLRAGLEEKSVEE